MKDIKFFPAILAKNKTELGYHAQRYLSFFEKIDVDLQEEKFSGVNTVKIEDILNNDSLKGFKEICWDVKYLDPMEQIRKIQENFEMVDNRFVVYQSSDVDFELLLEEFGNSLCLGIDADDELRDIEFYNIFSTIQLMTIEENEQGSEISEKLLHRSKELVEIGYEGEIGIDGGVNLESISVIKNYPITRLSVGSYFQKSDDLQTQIDLLKSELLV